MDVVRGRVGRGNGGIQLAGMVSRSRSFPSGRLFLRDGFCLLAECGILHRENRDEDWNGDVRGGRFWEHPVDWLGGGRAGVEFSFDFGLSVRAGLASLSELDSWTVGTGFALSNWLRVDYAFESHPTLSAVHRVSLEVSPGLFLYPERKKSVEAAPAKAANPRKDPFPSWNPKFPSRKPRKRAPGELIGKNRIILCL